MGEVLAHSLMITVFVAVMMILVEYINIRTQGSWKQILLAHPGIKYLMAGLLGAVPGCLGSFTVVALYLHGSVPLGALTTTMIVTSGDEAFVMLALFPGKYLLLTLLLLVVGIVAGALVDRMLRASPQPGICADLVLHENLECRCFPRGQIFAQIRRAHPARAALALGLLAFLATLVTGLLGPPDWNWVRVSLTLVALFGLFIALTVPDHFLVEHLWRHVILTHVPRVFLWTLGTMALLHFVDRLVDVESLVSHNRWVVLGVALLLGLIPESGPHLFFVGLFSQGALPFGILAANSVVQDGHGMLPVLAHSRRVFLQVKAINMVVGLLLGVLLLLLSSS